MPFKDEQKKKEYHRLRAIRNQEALDQLRSYPCIDCKQTYPPYVMEFDHVPERGKKLFNITSLKHTSTMSAPKLLAELAKCDVVCANCHKIRTHQRRQK